MSKTNPTENVRAMEVDLLPPWARHQLALTLHLKSPGQELSVTWYEFSRRSNFDKLDRDKIRQVAEDDGLVVYSRGPKVTDVGIDWAAREITR